MSGDKIDLLPNPIDWFEEPAKHSISSIFEDLNSATEALDLFRKYRRNHFNRLSASLKYIKILGMSEPIALLDVYSPAMLSTTIRGRLYEQDWRSAKDHAANPNIQRHRKEQLSRGDEYVEKQHRIVVLGGPGSGKTTFLRHLALAYCDKKVFRETNLKTSKFPFFISMISYAERLDDNSSIFEYLSKELREHTDAYAPKFVRRVLSKGLAVVILDSLDEIPPSTRKQVISHVRSFCKSFPHCKIILSCRTADYVEIFDDFYEVELARLTDLAIKKIVEAWFSDDPEKARELLRHMKRDDGVRSLCESPLLLSLLCIQFRHDLALPKRKTELYRRCIDAFLRDWDATRGFRRDSAYSSLSDDRKERIFETVAGSFFLADTKYIFLEKELVNQIADCCELYAINRSEAKNVLNEIERHHGILERYSADSFMFSHPSFQEYFVARHLVSKRAEMEALRRHFHDDRWSSVIEFITALHPDPTNLLMFLADKSNMPSIQNFPSMARRTRTLWLLYRSLCVGGAIPRPTRNILYEHIVNSHFYMSKTFMNGGVFPMAVLMPDGVKHTYVFYHKRQTLHEALQPLRLLANEILLSPLDEYAEHVVKRLNEIEVDGDVKERVSRAATLLCLAIPVAYSRPAKVKAIIERVISDEVPSYIKSIVDESRQILDKTV